MEGRRLGQMFKGTKLQQLVKNPRNSMHSVVNIDNTYYNQTHQETGTIPITKEK